MKKTEPEYYPPVENLLDLIYEHYTENNPVEKNTAAGKVAKTKEKELEEWLRGLEGMDRLVDDYVGDKIPLWEKIMDRQGTVCCTWEKTAFEEGLNITVQMYPCSEGTDTGSPALGYRESGTGIPHFCYMRVYSLNAGFNPYTSRMDL